MATRVTKAQLDRWAECNRQATELRRQASTLSKEADAIEAIAKADLESTGKQSVTRNGYRLEMVEGRMSVAWKDELIARCGAAVADESPPRVPRTNR